MSDIIKSFRRLFNRVFVNKHSIMHKLRFYFVLLSLTPLLVLGGVSYKISKLTIDNTALEYSKQLIRQTAENIDIRLEYYKDNMMQIITNPEIINLLMDVLKDSEAGKYSDGLISDTILATKLASYISTLQESKSISFISDKYYIKGTYYCADEELKGNALFYQKIIAGENNFAWFPTRSGSYGYDNDSHSVNVFSLGKQVYNINNMSRMNLCAVVDIREEVLADICNNIGRDKLPAQCFIIDSQGTVIAHPDKNLLFVSVFDIFPDSDVKKILELDANVSSFETHFLGDKVLANTLKLKTNDWGVVSVIKSEYLYKESEQVVKTIFLMATLCIIMSIIASYLVAWGISKPIKNIVGTMRLVVAGNLDVRIENTGNKSTSDEISILQESFNYMVSKIKELIENVYEEQNKKRISEIKALEAQINPHFLYNTLDTIKWTALLQKANNAAEMANLLSRLLHISLGKGKETIPIREEIEHVQCYLGIQKFRFNFDIEINYDIDKDTEHLLIPKLILQPIVENSILHGFAEIREGGIITIKCYREDDKLKIEVRDNGCGFDVNMAEVFIETKKKSGETFSGIGIANVYERIKLICGPEYGLHITSKVDEGTKVEIVLPIKEC